MIWATGIRASTGCVHVCVNILYILVDFGLCIPLLLKVRFHVDDPEGPEIQSYSDRYLEVKVNGEWGLVCYEPLTRSDLTVLCRDLQGKFGQRSRPSTASYYSSTKRLVWQILTKFICCEALQIAKRVCGWKP